jgi:hypothetical protein
VVAEHIEQGAYTNDGAEQVGPLSQRRPDQQAAIRASGDRQLLGRCVAGSDQPLGGGDEIVKGVLPFAPFAIQTPWWIRQIGSDILRHQ